MIGLLASLIGAGCRQGSPTASLTVHNETSEPICHIFIVSHSESDWGNDQLDGQPIVAGDSSTFTEIQPGLYNLRAETCERRSFAERYDTDLRGDVQWLIVED